MMTVEIYSTGFCPSCVRAKKLFEQKGIEYVEYKVDQDQDKFQEMKDRAKGRRSVPQIFINGEYIGGFDDLWKLEQQGVLDDKFDH